MPFPPPLPVIFSGQDDIKVHENLGSEDDLNAAEVTGTALSVFLPLDDTSTSSRAQQDQVVATGVNTDPQNLVSQQLSGGLSRKGKLVLRDEASDFGSRSERS